MKKINGVLYAPVENPNADREKMYVETSARAVVLDDNTTLQDKIDIMSNPVIISDTRPNNVSLWVKTTDDSFTPNISDLKPTIPDNTVPIHTLRTPADNNGIRKIVYPLTDSDQVYINGSDKLDNIVGKYDMGFEMTREKPDHKTTWGIESFETMKVGQEEIFVLNDFLVDRITVNGKMELQIGKIFEMDIGTMVLFRQDTSLINSATGVKTCEIKPVDETIVDISDFLVTNVTVEGREYDDIGESKIIRMNYLQETSYWAFFNPDKFIAQSSPPKVVEDTMWAEVPHDMTSCFATSVIIDNVTYTGAGDAVIPYNGSNWVFFKPGSVTISGGVARIDPNVPDPPAKDIENFATDNVTIDGTTYTGDPIITYNGSKHAFMDNDKAVISNTKPSDTDVVWFQPST